MKKITTILLGVFATLTLAAQPPMRPQGARPLPNQFRDFVDHQKKWSVERPQVEKKEGKVIITMSEDQFKRIQQMRQSQRFRQVRFNQQSCCGKCQIHNPRPHRGPRHNRI